MTRAVGGEEGMGTLLAPTGWGGRKSLGMGTLVPPGSALAPTRCG